MRPSRAIWLAALIGVFAMVIAGESPVVSARPRRHHYVAARHKTARRRHAKKKTKDETDETPAAAAGPPAAVKAPEHGDAGAGVPQVVSVQKKGDAGMKVYKFGPQEVQGRMKSPQIMYFLRRVRAEFAAGDLGHRSFMRELSDTRRSAVFR
jgi:hypothetical protein